MERRAATVCITAGAAATRLAAASTVEHVGPKRPSYGAYEPGEQSTQNVPALPWRLPRGQAVHSAAPTERSLPGLQEEHSPR